MVATVNESAIRSIVEQVVSQLKSGGSPNGVSEHGTGAAGVHGSVDDAVGAAKDAFEAFKQVSIEKRNRAIGCIRKICVEQSQQLGKMEMDETQIGRLDHKIEKLVTAGEKSPGVEFLRSNVYSGDHGLTVEEFAPFGVIAAITPVTHSLPTLANNAISMLASGNVVVVNAHPSGANVAKTGVRLFNEAIRKEIGIDNLITIIDPPTIDSAAALFDHHSVNLIVVTGGPAVARAALQSKKRAIVAGPGNPPVVVDHTACMDNAAKSIIRGGSYDNNLLCIGEKEVFAVERIFDKLMDAMQKHGAYRLSSQQIRDLETAVFQRSMDGSGKISVRKEFVGKDPWVLANLIGLKIPNSVELLYGETGEESPFVDHEQMMPFIPFVRVPDVDTGIRLAKKYEHGYRHTAVMHSHDVVALTKMGRELDTTLFIKNGPSMASLGSGGEGFLSFSIATPTGEGVTSPLTFTRFRRCTLVDSLRII
jgi:aldehyde dehydrogenase